MIEVSDKLRKELSDMRNADTTKLAYIGDAVYEVFVRLRSAEACGRHAGDMNKYTVHYVRADSQAKAARGLLKESADTAADPAEDSGSAFYTEEEAALFRRARNRTNTAHPRGCTPAEYKLATGFEAVIGWLYVRGDSDRAEAVMAEAVRIIDL